MAFIALLKSVGEMANGHRVLKLFDKIEAEMGRQISDDLFDLAVYLLDDAWSRGNRAGMYSASKIADDDEAVAKFWDGQKINYAAAAAIRAAIPVDETPAARRKEGITR